MGGDLIGCCVNNAILILKSDFEQIREQIHEIRNFLGPLDLKLSSLDHQITKSRVSFEVKALELESKMAVQSSEIALHSEQIMQIQMFLKMPQTMDNRAPTPVHKDKQSPIQIPSIDPPK